MDPFRDELAAAHEKIEQLEQQVRALKTRPDEGRSSADEARKKQLVVITIGTSVLLLVLGGGVAFWLMAPSTRTPPTTSLDYRGIAVAPVDSQPAALTTIPARPTPSGAVSAKPCNCTPGDPLCSCL